MIAHRNKPFSLLISGGHVIDPSNGINNVMDVAVSGGRIALVDEHIPPSNADRILDVSGYFVTPGLIDMHGHVFPARSYRELILEKLRPGDIHTCMFMPVIQVITESGALNPDVPEARKRGGSKCGMWCFGKQKAF